MDQLTSMKAFVAVADAGHFASASERLGLSRAMASKLVMDLEAHLGSRLLNRTTRKVSLTEPGAAYLERCRDILAAIEEAEREIAAQASEPTGRLRVTAPMSFGAAHVASRIAAYTARYARVNIDLILNDRLVDLVEEGYDLAIRIGRLADSSLIAKRIGATRLVVCASPGYLAAHGRPLKPADLADHECILYSYASAGAAWTFLGPKREETVRVRGRVTCNNGDAISHMATKGQGVIMQPDFIVAPHLRSGALEQVLTDYTDEPMGIYAIHASHRHAPLKLRTFIEFLSASIGDGR
jgi:DNA-binding transcriptional LysR family regulator